MEKTERIDFSKCSLDEVYADVRCLGFLSQKYYYTGQAHSVIENAYRALEDKLGEEIKKRGLNDLKETYDKHLAELSNKEEDVEDNDEVCCEDTFKTKIAIEHPQCPRFGDIVYSYQGYSGFYLTMSEKEYLEGGGSSPYWGKVVSVNFDISKSVYNTTICSSKQYEKISYEYLAKSDIGKCFYKSDIGGINWRIPNLSELTDVTDWTSLSPFNLTELDKVWAWDCN